MRLCPYVRFESPALRLQFRLQTKRVSANKPLLAERDFVGLYLKMRSFPFSVAKREHIRRISNFKGPPIFVAHWRPFFNFFGQGFPCRVNQPKKDALSFPWPLGV